MQEPKQQLMGLYEVAEFLGISRSAVRSRLTAEQAIPFPEPVAVLRCGPIWQAAAISEYSRERAKAGPTAAYRWGRERWKRHLEREQSKHAGEG
jgi:predicted DNA-binding transcriptional regulator AlpA